jgi:ketosteroid isomerase-like protein
MRALLLAPLLLIAIAARCQSNDAESLKALNAAFIHGYMTRDTASLSPIFADDFILINPSGQRRTRQEVLNGFISSPHFLSCDVDTVEIRLYGTIGLVLARAVFTTDENGKKTTGKTNYLDVYEKRKDRWVAVAAHVTYLGDH